MKKTKYYYKDGTSSNKYNSNKKLHRTDGPAVEYDSGNKAWFINDKRYRLDGPALECYNGNKYWFINDIGYTEEEFNNHPAVIRYNIKKDIKSSITDLLRM